MVVRLSRAAHGGVDFFREAVLKVAFERERAILSRDKEERLEKTGASSKQAVRIFSSRSDAVAGQKRPLAAEMDF